MAFFHITNWSFVLMPSQNTLNHLDKKDFWKLLTNKLCIYFNNFQRSWSSLSKMHQALQSQELESYNSVWPLLPLHWVVWKKVIPVKPRSSGIFYKPFSPINCRATSCWNFSKLSKSSFMWKSMRKGRPSSVSSCTENKGQINFFHFLRAPN